MNITAPINRFRKQKPYLRMGRYDICYYINPASALDRHIVIHGILNDWIATHLNKLIKPTSTVLDIGANAGLLTVPFAKVHVPEGVVIAFEPDKEVLKQLRINVALNDLSNVIIEPLALQDDPLTSEINFHLREARDGDGLLNKGISTIQSIDLHAKGTASVKAATIDTYVKDNKIKAIDFIKIDVEGAEYRVLKGGLETVQREKPIIHYEFSIVLDKLAETNNCAETFNMLADLGYAQYIIEEEKFLAPLKNTKSVTGDVNVLCLPNNGKGYSLKELNQEA